MRWLEQFGNPFYWVVVADADGKAAIDWGVYGAPETFLVDRNGIIRWKHVGLLSDAIIADELLPALQKRVPMTPISSSLMTSFPLGASSDLSL